MDEQTLGRGGPAQAAGAYDAIYIERSPSMWGPGSPYKGPVRKRDYQPLNSTLPGLLASLRHEWRAGKEVVVISAAYRSPCATVEEARSSVASEPVETWAGPRRPRPIPLPPRTLSSELREYVDNWEISILVEVVIDPWPPGQVGIPVHVDKLDAHVWSSGEHGRRSQERSFLQVLALDPLLALSPGRGYTRLDGGRLTLDVVTSCLVVDVAPRASEPGYEFRPEDFPERERKLEEIRLATGGSADAVVQRLLNGETCTPIRVDDHWFLGLEWPLERAIRLWRHLRLPGSHSTRVVPSRYRKPGIGRDMAMRIAKEYWTLDSEEPPQHVAHRRANAAYIHDCVTSWECYLPTARYRVANFEGRLSPTTTAIAIDKCDGHPVGRRQGVSGATVQDLTLNKGAHPVLGARQFHSMLPDLVDPETKFDLDLLYCPDDLPRSLAGPWSAPDLHSITPAILGALHSGLNHLELPLSAAACLLNWIRFHGGEGTYVPLDPNISRAELGEVGLGAEPAWSLFRQASDGYTRDLLLGEGVELSLAEEIDATMQYFELL